ncbi:MAG: alpha/beta fold hydrolase, partial [Desulfomonilia bacterium]|nr:alpha/beta fold hydrolase [Desulfomonilia bacterium]
MKRKRLLRMLALLVLAVLLLGVFAVLYAAYVYDPPEDRAFQSPYLDTVSSEHVKTDAFRFHYLHEGWGEPVVLVHGAATWLYSYRDNLPALAEHYSVYALDMPGHGYTDVLMENPTFDLDMMSEALLPSACEVDVMGAVSMYALLLASGNP